MKLPTCSFSNAALENLLIFLHEEQSSDVLIVRTAVLWAKHKYFLGIDALQRSEFNMRVNYIIYCPTVGFDYWNIVT